MSIIGFPAIYLHLDAN